MADSVLIVEDEQKIALLLRDFLRQDGFEVTMLHDGTDAVASILDLQPSIVLLDLNLPGKDGLTICREVRAESTVPIIMLTARVEEIDRLLGLELGADDYVCKPFSPREVVARVKSILRRTHAQPVDTQDQGLRYRDILIDIDCFEAHASDELLDLTPVEFRMLQTFLSQPGRVFTRDNLITSAYEDHRVVSSRTIDSHVKNLRHKISFADAEIQSIYGVGYKLL